MIYILHNIAFLNQQLPSVSIQPSLNLISQTIISYTLFTGFKIYKHRLTNYTQHNSPSMNKGILPVFLFGFSKYATAIYIVHIAPLNQILLSVSILWQSLYSTWYCALESDSIICVHSVTRFIFYMILRPWIRFYYLCPFCDKVYILRDIAPLNQILLSVSILWQGLYSTWYCALESESIICVHSVTGSQDWSLRQHHLT